MELGVICRLAFTVYLHFNETILNAKYSGSRLMWSLIMLSFGYCYHILKDRADLSKLVIRKSALSDQIAQKFGYCYQFYFTNAQLWAVFITNQLKLTLKIRQIRKMDKYIKNAIKKSNINFSQSKPRLLVRKMAASWL